MPGIARLGDKSDHGGTIVTASSTVFVNGIQAARVGDMHDCPIPGHGRTAIESTPAQTVNTEGSQLAVIGARCGCGATITGGSNNSNAAAQGGMASPNANSVFDGIKK